MNLDAETTVSAYLRAGEANASIDEPDASSNASDKDGSSHDAAVKQRGVVSFADASMLLVVAIWGANFAVVKFTLGEIPPLSLTATRFAFAAVLLLIILRVREGNLRVTRRELFNFAWLGFIGNTIYQVLFIYGLSLTTAANSALLIAVTPALIAVFGHTLGIEPITRRTFGGIMLAFAGIAVVMSSRGAALTRQTLTGDALVLGASFCWAIYTLGVRRTAHGVSPLRITTWTIVTGVPGLLILGLPSLAQTSWTAISTPAWGGLIYAALLALVVAYLLWNTSVRKVGSSRTSIFSCLIPLVATLVAWGVLGERPTLMQLGGGVLVIAGVLLTRR